MSHWSPSSFNFRTIHWRITHCSDWFAFYWFERVILTRSSHSQLHSLYIIRHHQHIKWASCDYQDTTSLTGVVGVESDLSLWWCNGRVKHFKNMTFSIKGRGGVLIEHSSLTYSLKKIPATNIFSPGANEGKIWRSLHVDTLSQSQSVFCGKHICWLLSFLRKSPKKSELMLWSNF